VSLHDLKLGDRIADGGQGVVFGLRDTPDLVFKKYHSVSGPDFNASALRALVAERGALSVNGQAVDLWAAWPTAVVVDAGMVVGFLMRRVASDFTILLGSAKRLADLSYLASEPRPLCGAVSLPETGAKLAILRHLASVMSVLHQRNLVLGDVSFANVLWSLTPTPRVMLLDCDGIAPQGMAPVLPHAQTIDWDDPHDAPGGAATMERDRYKLACAIVRVLGKSLEMRPDADLRSFTGNSGIDARIRAASVRAAERPGKRPSASEWMAVLSDRSSVAVDRPSQVRTITAPPPRPDLLPGAEARQYRPVQPPGGTTL
jgi:hypothetical protein